jgi:pimeloyl-ACP methyl ester carboxylesterase
VGHSFGGLTVRLFASTYPDDVTGLVLVDPVHPRDWLEENLSAEQKGKLMGGARLARYGALLARLGLARFTALLGRTVGEGTAQSFVSFLTGGAVRGGGALAAPIGKLPPEQRPMVGAFWKQPKVYQAMAGQVESLPESAAQVAATGDYGDLPLVVLSAEGSPESQRKHGETLARRSSRGKHIVAAGSGHWIHLDEPELVIEAIREVIEEAQVAAEKSRAQEAEK